ncbi:DUF2971 domain-containing protein [Haladaptatus sp. CMAA 1911]|uniref:DUF2971 domain-containing protein n=1 Tax=unclassified Haladaptatus TaxID=2622732 RepID=UPI0037549342
MAWFEEKVPESGEWKLLLETDYETQEPKNVDNVWRYRSLGEYITILDREALWFSRADKLGDPFEGSLPEQNIEKREENHSKLRSDQMKSSHFLNVYFTYINCWHMNSDESNTMWETYTNDAGIAIVTTLPRLKNAIKRPEDKMSFGKVQYVDYKNDTITQNNAPAPFFNKREEFKDESEYRFLFQKSFVNSEGKKKPHEIIPHQGKGVPVSVDVNTLVEKVLLSPNAPGWLEKTVNSVTEKYGYDFEIKPSNMVGNPDF